VAIWRYRPVSSGAGGRRDSLGGDQMMFSRVSARLVGFCAIALVAGVVAAPGAAASPKKDDGDVLKTLNQLIAMGAVEIDTHTGRVSETGPLKRISQLIDTATGAVLGPGALQMQASADGPTSTPFSCVENSRRKQLSIYAPSNRYLSSDKGTVHFQYHPYRLAKARKVGSGLSTQWEVCSVGGGDMDAARLLKVGTGVALNDASNFRRIGQAWQSGSTPENYSLGLEFQVEKEPVTIGASLTQQPADKLLGSFRAPYRSGLDAFERNAVYAWWQDNCIGRWYRCWRNSGSKDFQGTIAHGLWEFRKGTEPAIVSFYYAAFATT
jgi:hypothetical protein